MSVKNDDTSWISQTFPSLESSGYRFTSDATREYNCIAWAAGEDDIWWWPHHDSYWPDGISKEEKIEVFIEAYQTIGYEICKTSTFEKEYEKIAIYTKIIDGKSVPTHAARQLSDGKWTSKLGEAEDIEHNDLNAISGSVYGCAVCFMKRPIT
jgi:hypothetical protein